MPPHFAAPFCTAHGARITISCLTRWCKGDGPWGVTQYAFSVRGLPNPHGRAAFRSAARHPFSFAANRL